MEKNFNVMITGLQVELEKENSFRENLKGNRYIFASKFTLKNIEINIPQIKN